MDTSTMETADPEAVGSTLGLKGISPLQVAISLCSSEKTVLR